MKMPHSKPRNDLVEPAVCPSRVDGALRRPDGRRIIQTRHDQKADQMVNFQVQTLLTKNFTFTFVKDGAGAEHRSENTRGGKCVRSVTVD